MLDAVLVVALLLFLNGVFVAAEFGAVAARRNRIHQLAEQGSGSAKMLLGILTDPTRLDRYISACQLGITTTSLALGAYGVDRAGVSVGNLQIASIYYEYIQTGEGEYGQNS